MFHLLELLNLTVKQAYKNCLPNENALYYLHKCTDIKLLSQHLHILKLRQNFGNCKSQRSCEKKPVMKECRQMARDGN